MKYINVDLDKTAYIDIGTQYDKKALTINFINIDEDYDTYIFYRQGADDYGNTELLDNYQFIVTSPLTDYSGDVEAQLITMDEFGEEYIKMSKPFIMHLNESVWSSEVEVDENN